MAREEPETFVPFAGAWGRRGCTKVMFVAARSDSVRQTFFLAWLGTALARLLRELEW